MFLPLFLMRRVRAAEGTIFLQFEPIRIIFLVLRRSIDRLARRLAADTGHSEHFPHETPPL